MGEGNLFILELTFILSFNNDLIGTAYNKRLPWWLSGKESACHCRTRGFHPWVRKGTWKRKWQPTPVFLPGTFHGWRKLVGYSPQDHKRVGHDWSLSSCVHAESLRSCLTLCNPMDCSPPGSSIYGILQARVLEWVVISFSRGSSLTQRSNPGLPHSRQMLYPLSHQGVKPHFKHGHLISYLS